MNIISLFIKLKVTQIIFFVNIISLFVELKLLKAFSLLVFNYKEYNFMIKN